MFHTPLLILVLIGGTALVLWRILRSSGPGLTPDPPATMTLPPTVHDTRPPLARRGADLERLADEPWDLLVVGGGIVGAGAFLDAASRGLRVALVEQDDIASGTSSRSSRLIHGGLRYLQQLEVRLVREALPERARLLRLAPHLVRLEAFLFPLYGPPAVDPRLLRGRDHAVRPARQSSIRAAGTGISVSRTRSTTRPTS